MLLSLISLLLLLLLLFIHQIDIVAVIFGQRTRCPLSVPSPEGPVPCPNPSPSAPSRPEPPRPLELLPRPRPPCSRPTVTPPRPRLPLEPLPPTDGRKFPLCSIGHRPLWVSCLALPLPEAYLRFDHIEFSPQFPVVILPADCRTGAAVLLPWPPPFLLSPLICVQGFPGGTTTTTTTATKTAKKKSKTTGKYQER